MVLYVTLLNTQHYKEQIKNKHHLLHVKVVAIEKEAFGSPEVDQLTIVY